MASQSDLDSLEYWANQRGYYIDFAHDGDDSVDRVSKIISINTTRSLETQVYILLHECGHILVYNNDKVMGFRKIADRYEERTKISKVFTVMEEVEAWKRGKTLAKRLCISINEDKWNRDVARAIKKYMEWAVK